MCSDFCDSGHVYCAHGCQTVSVKIIEKPVLRQNKACPAFSPRNTGKPFQKYLKDAISKRYSTLIQSKVLVTCHVKYHVLRMLFVQYLEVLVNNRLFIAFVLVLWREKITHIYRDKTPPFPNSALM